MSGAARAVRAAWIAVPALGWPLATYVLLGDVDLNLADEGFLWHGVQCTRAGLVPIRDFQAYDPGRYWLLSATARLFGDGVLGLRAGLACVQAAALFFGLAALRRVVPHPAWLVPLGGLLQAWLFPLHKVVEPTAALACAWAATRLVERPSLARHAAAGAVAGLAGVFGRNLGLYDGLALAATALVVVVAERAWRNAPARLAALAGGAVLGLVPLLAALALVQGFASAFGQSIADTAAASNADFALPWPWPWSAPAVGPALAFLLPVLVLPPLAVLALVTPARRLGERALAIACAATGLCFLHHVAARSDAPHLAQSIHPVLIGGVALGLAPVVRASARARHVATGLALALLAGVGAPALLAGHPRLVGLRDLPDGRAVELRERAVAGETLRLPPWTFDYLRRFEGVLDAHVPDDAPLLVAPLTPALYPVSGRRSPIWTTYFLFEEGPERERERIAELEAAGVDWAWITLDGADGRADKTLERTHPLIWSHLALFFEPVSDRRLPPSTLLLRRRAR